MKSPKKCGKCKFFIKEKIPNIDCGSWTIAKKSGHCIYIIHTHDYKCSSFGIISDSNKPFRCLYDHRFKKDDLNDFERILFEDAEDKEITMNFIQERINIVNKELEKEKIKKEK